jgi:hypothetical protein
MFGPKCMEYRHHESNKGEKIAYESYYYRREKIAK